MRIQETTVYSFDELSETAKEKARDWYRQATSDDFSQFGAESALEDANRMATMLGIDISTHMVKLMGGGTRQDPTIYYSGFCSQGDGASFSGTYAYKAGSVQAVAKEAPTGDGKAFKGNNELNRIARELQAIQRPHFYRLQASISASGRSLSHFIGVDVERSDSVNVPSEDVDALTELIRDFADWIYRQLEREYEYLQSNESVDESIRANEYEFTEHGGRA